VETRYCDRLETDLDRALHLVDEARRSRQALSVGLVGNIAEVLPELVRRGVVPDVLTDQTSAHDLRVGYIPAGLSLERAAELRERDPAGYEQRVLDSMVAHVEAMLALQARGAVTFDYGNNLRGQVADHRGCARRSRSPLRAGVHPPAVLRGAGPFLGALPAIRRTSPRQTGRCWRRSRGRTRWPAGSGRLGSGSNSRVCRPGSAGWSTESGPRWGSGSTGWSSRGR
jgi:urocanate hydratase